MGLSLPREDMETYFKNAISVCPRHFGACSHKFKYLTPKWHGSKTEMFNFAKECQEWCKDSPLMCFILVDAYCEVHKVTKDENFLGRNDIWPIIAKAYQNYFTVYPEDIRKQFYYAYHAYKADKYDIAYDAFEKIGDRWMFDTDWNSLEQYNKARALVHYHMGVELAWNRRLYETSISYFLSSIKYRPTANAYYGLGSAYWQTGYSLRNVSLLKKAEAALSKAVELEPDYEAAKGVLAKVQNVLKSQH